MKKSKTWINGSVITCAVLLSIFAGCVGQGTDMSLKYIEEVKKTFGESLEVMVTSLDFETYNGDIEIHFWNKQEYEIVVYKWARAKSSAEAIEKAKEVRVDFSVLGKKMRLKIGYKRNAGADIIANLPKESCFPNESYDTIELSSTYGTITARAITADDIRVDTTNGKIDIECGDDGQYTVNSTNGEIVIKTGPHGEFDISTINGSIDITVAGDFYFCCETINATVEVEADEVTYKRNEETYKKGYTVRCGNVSITAFSINGSITVTKK